MAFEIDIKALNLIFWLKSVTGDSFLRQFGKVNCPLSCRVNQSQNSAWAGYKNGQISGQFLCLVTVFISIRTRTLIKPHNPDKSCKPMIYTSNKYCKDILFVWFDKSHRIKKAIHFESYKNRNTKRLFFNSRCVSRFPLLPSPARVYPSLALCPGESTI